MNNIYIKEKNLTQKQFVDFYDMYIHKMSKVSLAEWIIRILPEDTFKQMTKDIDGLNSYMENEKGYLMNR